MNRFTLIIDLNWLCQSRFAVMTEGFKKDNPDAVKQKAQMDLRDLMARSINVIINRFKSIDNIIIVADGGSWRKEITPPRSISNVVYKGNREERRVKQDVDFKWVWETITQIVGKSKELGITVCKAGRIEGDDWIAHWSKYLNSRGVNCIIWSSDCDLKQLVQCDPNTNAYTVWYNDKKGCVLPQSLYDDSDDIEFFMKPQPDNQVLEDIKRRSTQVTYISPDSIALEKFLCGDSGDNIRPAVSVSKNGKTYGISKKTCEKILTDLNIDSIHTYIRSIDRLADYIMGIGKFKDAHIDRDDLKNRLTYNVRMVWLNNRVIPQDIQQIMAESEYKLFDIDYLRTNYRSILPEDTSEIEMLFEGSQIGDDTENLPF